MCRESEAWINAPRWTYSVVAEESFHIDVGPFPTYGIRLTGQDYEETMHDVSVCEETVSHMARLFNEEQLFPCHFVDVVRDMIS